MLEGELCVDPNDACCCSDELQVAEPSVGGPACIVEFAGTDIGPLTFELVTRDGGTVLPRLTSMAQCGSGGWWSTTGADFTTVELCDETCSIRRSETTRLRALWNCPATPC